MKRAIINVSTNNAWYSKGQERLRKSIPGENFFGMLGEASVLAPAHTRVPYAFKPLALDYLHNKGYDLVLWLDASMWAVKPLAGIWDIIERKGWLMEESGHYLGRWCNDRALANMGITREQAMKITMYSAGMTGLNLKKAKCQNFLMEWKKYALDMETFVGSHTDHRHDMSVASFLAHKYEMDYERGGTYLAYIGKVYGQPSETSVFHLAGMS